MPTASDQIIDDHKQCDALFLSVEQHVGQYEWEQAFIDFLKFNTAFRRHIAMEESIFFPLIRDSAGEDAWPLKDLQSEHAKLEMILLRIEESIRKRSKDDFLLHAESFFILMHTHSIKEEQILYPKLEAHKRKASVGPGTDKSDPRDMIPPLCGTSARQGRA
ncbi:hemerythrin domain-containing protein [Noviherbaspirillum sp.]|uniref:hemerythrin domain-containing protein n=1 Tax=Noviherbaspirillum sp. TaxID=1926288 RepID=UPI002FE08FE8